MLKISYIVSSFVMPLHKSGKGTTGAGFKKRVSMFHSLPSFTASLSLSLFSLSLSLSSFTNTHTIFFSKINVDALEYERTPKNAPGERWLCRGRPVWVQLLRAKTKIWSPSSEHGDVSAWVINYQCELQVFDILLRLLCEKNVKCVLLHFEA